MTRARRLLPLAAAAACLTGGAAAGADPAGRSTLEERVVIPRGQGYRLLDSTPGEPFQLRQGSLGHTDRGRTRRRRSLIFFGQVTDPQIVDEMSPARVDLVDPAAGSLKSAWRPQEAFGAQVLDQIVRNVNLNRTSAVRQGDGRRRRLQFVIGTGDFADNQQRNEIVDYVSVLDGRRVDPFSGRTVGGSNPCPAQSEETIARLNADVAARRYTGVQDYDDYPDAPDVRKSAFWDPDEPPPAGGPYASWPRYPGLMDRAQQAFQAEGLAVPWYTARGNHDGLVTGNVYATFSLARALITGCQKVFPSASFDPNIYRGRSESEVFDDIVRNPQRQQEILAGARPVPPDPDRRFVDQREYKMLHDTGDDMHGYGFVDRTELRRSNGTATYYAFNSRRGFRFISLDTVADGGCSCGNIDDPQYRWLKRELDRNSSREFSGRRLVRDRDRDRLIVVYGHHTLRSMSTTVPDEEAGECRADYDPGCDRDPRRSRPIHRGLAGRATIRDLLLRYPNVIAYVAGHTHKADLTPYARPGGASGFWEINTPSDADFPQQSRLIEILDNRDGTFSIFGTLLDHAAPIDPPMPGTPGSVFTEPQLASLSRVLAANDPQGLGPRGEGRDGGGARRRNAGRGRRNDRNAELLIRDPRLLGD